MMGTGEEERAMPARSEEILERLMRFVAKSKRDFEFAAPRRLLDEAKEAFPGNRWIKQQLALCTYLDEELPPRRRFSEAAGILENLGLRDPSNRDAEVLGSGGDLYMAMWEHGGQVEHLYESLNFFRAAHERDPENDMGYGGVRAAFILDILSERIRTAAGRSRRGSGEADGLKRQAEALRSEVVEKLIYLLKVNPFLGSDNGFVASLAEAYFGLEDYSNAGKWLAGSRELGVSEWEMQTTFRRLVSLARLKGKEPPHDIENQDGWDEAWRTLRELMGEKTGAALSCYHGKVGLALSGGGFRASFYHLGVLARLAEMGVLEGVEVISTVSGGSILGAHYYLKLKYLLETTEDGRINRESYVKILQELITDFTGGVQKNIRARTFSDLRKNLAMIFFRNYTRSHRIGELYEEVLFSRAGDGHPPERARYMRELLIAPRDEMREFRPRLSNWRRRAKVPVLLLNATSLNTGHNWRFTARSMGEPPGLLGGEVDKNSRYRRLWYEEAPREELRAFRLGYAVAASACVPGLLEPLVLDGLYPERVVRLVDGGVHDNQGVAGLLDEGCNFVLCSDAAGQMEDRERPSGGLLSVLLRSNSVITDRVREAEYLDLLTRLEGHAIRGLFFVHMKKDLRVRPRDWIGCRNPTPELEKEETAPPYGVDPLLQRLLASLRTDLDSFSEVEASALMASGYLMTEQQFKDLQREHEKTGRKGKWGGYDPDAPRGDWPFLSLEPLLKCRDPDDPARSDLERQLRAGTASARKVWNLDARLRVLGWIAALTALVFGVLYIRCNWSEPLFSLSISVGGFVLTLALVLGTLLFPSLKWFFPERAARGIFLRAVLCIFGFIAAQVHLLVFDRIFLRRGRLSRLLERRR